MIPLNYRTPTPSTPRPKPPVTATTLAACSLACGTFGPAGVYFGSRPLFLFGGLFGSLAGTTLALAGLVTAKRNNQGVLAVWLGMALNLLVLGFLALAHLAAVPR